MVLLEEDGEFEEISATQLVCNCGHHFGRNLACHFANCFLKNLAKELTGPGAVAGSTERKTTKLAGSSAR